MNKNKLHFLCGKMAAGKSTLSNDLAMQYNAIVLCEDEILTKLYPTEITRIEDYLRYSSRLKDVMKDLVKDLLKNGNDVVMDFPANTKTQRIWFRNIFESVNVGHILHFVDKSDEVCKEQLKKRSQHLPEGTPFTSELEFEMITKYFEPPCKEENFEMVVYKG